MKVQQNFNEWFSSKGDETLMLDHDLNDNSHVLEIGGFKGIWVSDIIKRYNPYVYIFEPIEEYYNFLCKKFENNPKIKIFKLGISDKTEIKKISLIDDASSIISESSKGENIELISFKEMKSLLNISNIDLMQINIEGAEYDLLNFALKQNLLFNINKILIQFHTNIDNCECKRNEIQTNLVNSGFCKIFDFPFIWEGWIKNK